MDAAWPDGFVYRPDFVTAEEEAQLVAAVRTIEFGPVVMHGVVARRRVAHFGWNYGYESWRIEPGPSIPDFLTPLRARSAELIDVSDDDLAEVLVTEYSPGAGIGWHRDAPQFGRVVGVSLLGECRMRFQRGRDAERRASAATLAPRSAYVLAGAARSAWQHSIPPTKTLRYSITFRTMSTRAQAGSAGSRAPSAAETLGDSIARS